MRLASWWLAAGLVAGVAAQGEVAKYRADGATTFCKVGGAGLSSYSFMGLYPSSMGKCPLLVSMKVALQSATASAASFDVSWTVSLNLNKSGVLYPADVVDGKVKVMTPLLQACPTASDCDNTKTVVKPVSVIGNGPDSLEISQRGGEITLASYRFQLPTSGEYLIVANVGVLSDSVDTVENLVFQRVQTASNGSTLPGTILPSATQAPDPVYTPRPLTTVATPAPVGSLERVVSTLPVSSSSSQPGSQDASAKETASSSSSGPSEMTALVLASIAVVALALVALFFVQRRRKENAQKPPKVTELTNSLDSNDMYQLTDKGQIDGTSPVPPLHDRPAQAPHPYVNDSMMESTGAESELSASGFSSFSTIRDDSVRFVIREDSLASYKIPVGQLRTDTVRDDPMTMSEMMLTTKSKKSRKGRDHHDRAMTLSEMMASDRNKSHRSHSRRRKDRHSQSIVTHDEDTVWL